MSERASVIAPASANLPRLLYLGDVPVEASYHGSALLYRLLQTYPTDKLTIVEAGVEASKPERRLPDVPYHAVLMLLSRLQTTRFAPYYTAACLRAAALRARSLESLARRSQPDAILTVTHGTSWITAAELGRQLDVPVHLICHDEWARAEKMQAWKDRVFSKYYRAAASRFCVSPFMSWEYARRYGAESVVLYPSRAADTVHFRVPPERLASNSNTFTCAFAGTINGGGIVSALQQLARGLEPLSGRLLIYGPLTAALARASGLDGPTIELGGLLPPAKLMDALRERADTLIVPMSFDPADGNNMKLSFPSKFTDYTCVGLPLLIYGPPDCSAVRWAAENEGIAEVVSQESNQALAATLCRLARDPQRRMAMARKSIAVGEAYFSHRTAIEVLHRALCTSGPTLSDARHDAQASPTKEAGALV